MLHLWTALTTALVDRSKEVESTLAELVKHLEDRLHDLEVRTGVIAADPPAAPAAPSAPPAEPPAAPESQP